MEGKSAGHRLEEEERFLRKNWDGIKDVLEDGGVVAAGHSGRERFASSTKSITPDLLSEATILVVFSSILAVMLGLSTKQEEAVLLPTVPVTLGFSGKQEETVFLSAKHVLEARLFTEPVLMIDPSNEIKGTLLAKDRPILAVIELLV